ncbi:hypothetical protein DIURU_004781 [Diutina rugosa]|uniref:Uncharacterized protein n=1 Tax=Diutina rugosa TaxID=5481 RepID=A0A642UF73_DIURU|nr:uncharacterized protein DIURU_004781 [Diutina rugosa]KAA8897928.1 hypothetical protein DIURU_004781 [Diutina rugosa]
MSLSSRHPSSQKTMFPSSESSLYPVGSGRTGSSALSYFSTKPSLLHSKEGSDVHSFVSKPRRWPFRRGSSRGLVATNEPPLIDTLGLDATVAKVIAQHRQLTGLHDKMLADWQTWASGLPEDTEKVTLRFTRMFMAYSTLFDCAIDDFEALHSTLLCIRDREIKQRRLGKDRYHMQEQAKQAMIRNGPQSYDNTKLQESLEENLNSFRFVKQQLKRAIDSELRESVDQFTLHWGQVVHDTDERIEGWIKENAQAVLDATWEEYDENAYSTRPPPKRETSDSTAGTTGTTVKREQGWNVSDEAPWSDKVLGDLSNVPKVRDHPYHQYKPAETPCLIDDPMMSPAAEWGSM